ncbi:MAG: 3-isopropylmalate dehydratase small subunit [Clostridia bacterium]|nr:3-isopropylmalate dehydratase small subunit [Clostridia bacterium]
MQTSIKGKVLVLGDNIDTDQIYPGRYLELVEPDEVGSHCLEGVDPRISAEFPVGGIVVAGVNFGCGSSREHAPIALLNMGASLVLAESFARIFYRNAINLGLPLVICPGLKDKVATGDFIEADILNGQVTVSATGEKLFAEPLGGQALKILKAGGIKPLMRQVTGREENYARKVKER